MCCECGTWVTAFAVLDERLRDPWGNALRQTTVDHARTFIRMVLESGPGGWDWGWGVPVTIGCRSVTTLPSTCGRRRRVQ